MKELGTYSIHQTPLEDGRSVYLGVQEGGVTIRESLDGEEEGVYLSYHELAYAVFIVLKSQGFSPALLVQQMMEKAADERTSITQTA